MTSFVYLDNVIFLLENTLFVKTEKCEFHSPSVLLDT